MAEGGSRASSVLEGALAAPAEQAAVPASVVDRAAAVELLQRDSLAGDCLPSDEPGRRPSEAPRGRAAASDERIAELEVRLQERVEENVVLDREVRCLFAERQVLHEYVASIEEAMTRLPCVERAWADAEAALEAARHEIDAYRNRLSRVVVDRIVVSMRRFPVVYRLGKVTVRHLADRRRVRT